MSGSQKVLRVFGIIELILGILSAIGAIRSGGFVPWLSVACSLIAAYLLLTAAKDASKIMGAWLITLVALILCVAELIFALLGEGNKTAAIIGSVIAIILNLIAFIAANNVKKQANK